MIDLVILPLALPLAGALLLLLVGWVGQRLSTILLVATALANLALALWLRTIDGRAARLLAVELSRQRFDFELRADGLGMLLVVLAAAGAVLLVIALAAYPTPRPKRRGIALLLALAAANGLALAANLATFYVFAGLLSLLLLILLLGEGEARGWLAGFRLFATVEITGFPLLFAVIVSGGRASGGWDDLRLPGDEALLYVIFAAVVFRTGLAPAQSWLSCAVAKPSWPGATAALVFMPAAGAFVLLRLQSALFLAGVPIHGALLALGIASLAAASYQALQQRDPRRMIAALAIAQAGFFALGLAADRPAGDEAALWQLIFSALMLPIPLVALAALDSGRNQAGSYDRRLAVLVVGAGLLAAAGMPPFFGFYARLSVLQALLASGSFVHLLGVMAVLICTGLLAYGALKALGSVLAAAPATKIAVLPQGRPQRVSRSRLRSLPLAAAALMALCLALAPDMAQRWLAGPAASVLSGSASQPFQPFALSTAPAAIMLLLALFAGSLSLFAPGKPQPLPALPVPAKLSLLAAVVENWRERGLLDPANVSAAVVLGVARGVALTMDRVLARLAI